MAPKLALNVVLEGPDGGGKTTLAATLHERYGCLHQHAGPPRAGIGPAALARDYARMVTPRLEIDGQAVGVVADRWALGETIYGPLFRGRSLIGKAEWTALSCLLDATATPLVLCLPPKSVAMASWQDRLAEERFKDPLAVSKVYDAYATFAYGGNPALRAPRWQWVYDYTDPRALALLLDYLDALAEKQR